MWLITAFLGIGYPLTFYADQRRASLTPDKRELPVGITLALGAFVVLWLTSIQLLGVRVMWCLGGFFSVLRRSPRGQFVSEAQWSVVC
jgi:hypothetical protein